MDAQTRLNPTLREFVSGVQKLWESIAEQGIGSRPNMRTVELELRSLLQQLGQEATEFLFEAYGTGKAKGQRCGACGGSLHFKSINEKELMTLQGGRLHLERAYYYCQTCQQGCLPLDVELGLTRAELTPALADVVELV